MRIHLSQITEEGQEHRLDIPISSLRRLTDGIGAQKGRLTAELSLKQRGGNIEVVGWLKVDLSVPCQRCLDPVTLKLEEPVKATFAPERLLDEMEVDLKLSSADLDVSFFTGEELDLIQVLEEEIFLLLPESVCGEDEMGRCTHCGKELKELYDNSEDDPKNHPFHKMKDLLQ